MDKPVIGLLETVKVCGKSFRARIDTGARRSSIDKQVAKELGLGPVVKKVKVRSVHGKSERPVVRTTVILKGIEISALFNLADRKHMTYDVLIGRNVLKQGFFIDTTK